MHVALIDDDPAVLDSLTQYLRRQAIVVTGYVTADAFIARQQSSQFDCIVADVRMPGLSGMDLVRRFAEEGCATPIILITGHGDIDMAVAAIKLGAFDFIEKPFDESRLLESIHTATANASNRQRAAAELAETRARLQMLTERQRQVLDLAVTGLSNKEIAERLGISFRTVENHRAWMMERMGARNLADLVRMHMMINSVHDQ
jgi:two-component system response regulator FixJ